MKLRSTPYITADAGGPKPVVETDPRIEQMTEGLLERTRKPFEAVLKDAGMTVDKIDEVAGGWFQPHADGRRDGQANGQWQRAQ